MRRRAHRDLYVVLAAHLDGLRRGRRAAAACRRAPTGRPSTCSRYRSVTSGPRLVKPQAMSALWPMITPGTPEKVKPATSSGQSSGDLPAVQAHLHPDAGHSTPRCGSLASSGSPVAECSPRPPSSCCPCRRRVPSERRQPRRARSCSPASAPAGRRGTAAARGCGCRPLSASGSKTPSTMAPWVTIGGVAGVVVLREQLGDLLRRWSRTPARGRSRRPCCRLQVPGHRLEPGQRVDRGPRLGAVVEARRGRARCTARRSPTGCGPRGRR